MDIIKKQNTDNNVEVHTNQKKIEEDLKKKNIQLGERIKELNCLYGISKLISRTALSLEEIFGKAVELLPPSWQYPKITCARIKFQNKEFRSGNFNETKWVQRATIFLNNEEAGVVEVYYKQEMPFIDEGPFLKEERHLIDALGRLLGDIAGKKEAEEKLKESLLEKEILLQEIHHRAKNNLQVISTLLRFQRRQSSDEDIQKILREIQNRLDIMAFIHEKLYGSKQLLSVDLETYLRSIATKLMQSLNLKSNKTKLIIDIDNLKLNIKAAIPCALIINELITNSIKYAFPGNMEGEITVKLYRDNKGIFQLKVADNGVGIPDEIDFDTTRSIGLKIVRLLVNQLHGEINLSRLAGTQFEISFPGKR